MAKFYAFACDKTIKDNNGGSLILFHHLHALEALGHTSGGMLNLTDPIPEDCDFILHQSEWWNVIKDKLDKSNAKRICWVGHYNTGSKYQMPPLEEIKADYYHTQYIGECVKWGEERIGKEIFYLPHAGCLHCGKEGSLIETDKTIFIGNHFPERSEDWLEGVSLKQCWHQDAKDYYRSAVVCPNIHGGWQKREATEFFQTPGMMINDRIFNIILGGGFAISDNNPIVKKFFTSKEVPWAETKDEFQDMIKFFVENPEERLPYMHNAKERIMKEHLHIHHIKDFLKHICLE